MFVEELHLIASEHKEARALLVDVEVDCAVDIFIRHHFRHIHQVSLAVKAIEHRGSGFLEASQVLGGVTDRIHLALELEHFTWIQQRRLCVVVLVRAPLGVCVLVVEHSLKKVKTFGCTRELSTPCGLGTKLFGVHPRPTRGDRRVDDILPVLLKLAH